MTGWRDSEPQMGGFSRKCLLTLSTSLSCSTPTPATTIRSGLNRNIHNTATLWFQIRIHSSCWILIIFLKLSIHFDKNILITFLWFFHEKNAKFFNNLKTLKQSSPPHPLRIQICLKCGSEPAWHECRSATVVKKGRVRAITSRMSQGRNYILGKVLSQWVPFMQKEREYRSRNI